MKKKFHFALIASLNTTLMLIGAGTAQATETASPAVKPEEKKASLTFKNDEEKVSYIIGHQIASNIRGDGIAINKEALLKALKEGLEGKESVLDEKESHEAFQKYMIAQQTLLAEKNLKIGNDFLEKNKKDKEVITLPSGLQYKIITTGTGPKPKATDTVSVHYEGKLVDGKIFDSSYARGEPVSFPVNGVIKGWTEALQIMPEGSTWMLYIPAELAYGTRAPSPKIGPNSTLIFKVNLISIAKPAQETTTPKPSAQPTTAPSK